MRTYEYHETLNTIPSGFMFALFSLRNASLHTIRDQLQDPNILFNLDSECVEELQTIRVKKNLGSLIESVKDFSVLGYTVSFIQGDVCDSETGERFSSEMEY